MPVPSCSKHRLASAQRSSRQRQGHLLVDQQYYRYDKHSSCQEDVGQREVVFCAPNNLYSFVGIATLEQDSVIEDAFSLHKVKHVLVPRYHRVNASGAQRVTLHIISTADVHDMHQWKM